MKQAKDLYQTKWWLSGYKKEYERIFFFYATVLMAIAGILLHVLTP